MIQSKGIAAQSAKTPLAPFSFERRDPKEHDVVIAIHYCGICHSDIHQARDEWGGATFPMVPGHEITGIVTSVGDRVTKFKAGDPVGVGCMVDACRVCEPCRNGLQQYCQDGVAFTYNSTERDGKTPTFGGYSNNIVVDENFVLRLPKNLPLDASSPLLCAGITLYSPLKHWKAGPGKKVAIVGLGGLGHMGVKIAAALGAFSLIIGRRSLAGSLIGGLPETQEMLDFCGDHNITSDIELIPIQKVNEAYERMLKSDVRYRFVIDMKSLADGDHKSFLLNIFR
ncbi:MAG: NAD(P)-dependent alcohol dehydrogenase [Deltaproteobacteria bacterium]|nr:MAG: NAD(P)-dependent alcohol dehydrogenase [Deltaproteobacteria bacterium]